MVFAMPEQKCDDRRGRRVVFLSHCLLDQNVRFPGIAVEAGGIGRLVRGLTEAGIGIEQLPCVEMKYWGGVDRWLVMPFLGLSTRALGSSAAGLFTTILNISLGAYRMLCEFEAWKVSRTIMGFLAHGYDILGIVLMNDSPTCGLDMTIDMREFVVEARGREVDWSCPSIDTMSRLLPELLRDGSGMFALALRRRMNRSTTPVDFYGFDPWSDIKAESDRLLSRLLPV